MFVLSNLGDFFFWVSGLGHFCLFMFVAKSFISLFRKDNKF